MHNLNNAGCSVYVSSIVEPIPISVLRPIDAIAGCVAVISEQTTTISTNADSTIADLCHASSSDEALRIESRSPFITNML